MTITAVAAVLFGVLGAFGLARRESALTDVRTSAAQLIALQEVRVAAVRADAVASASYLVGGEEDPAQRQDYLDQIAGASDGLIAIANRVDSAAAAPLAQASALLSRYVGLVEQARSNNRQGFPVGAAYQRQANALMSSDSADVTDVVDALAAAEAVQRDRVNEALSRAQRAGTFLHLFGWTLLAVIALGGAWLSRTFRRLVNVPLAIGGGVLLVVLLAGIASQVSAMSRANDAVSGPLATADLAAQARSAAYDARSQEALTLINRGNGQANQARWVTAANTTLNALDGACALSPSTCDLGEFFDRYIAAHAEVRAADDGGDWDRAVALQRGIDPGSSGSNVVSTFTAFADDSGAVIGQRAAQADAALRDAPSSLGTWRIITFLAGLVVAALVVAGYSQRIGEYR